MPRSHEINRLLYSGFHYTPALPAMQAIPGTEGLYRVDEMNTPITAIPTAQLARRKSIVMKAKIDRVITRPYLP